MLGMLLVIACYASTTAFLAGFVGRLLRWASTPVPFRIPTTAGQQRSLEFLRHARVENPSSALGVTARVALEIALFRSLFRNTGHRRHAGWRLSFPGTKELWAAAIAFHWSLLLVVVRHLRLVTEPVPAVVNGLSAIDGWFQVGLTAWYASDVVLAVALAWLLIRRLRVPLLRYLTLPADYAALVLLISVAGTGMAMRYWARTDIVAAKAFALGLVTFRPAPAPEGTWFAVHVLLACALIAVAPFTKLMHAPAVLFSPTRALANDSRRRRHVNPWNAPVAVHTYAEWEGEFRQKIQAAGLPVEDEGT